MAGIYRTGGRARPQAENPKSFVALYPFLGELTLLRRRVGYSWNRAGQTLDFRTSLSLADGLLRSASWCRIDGIL
jgi:hypothetical protein